MIKRGGWGAEKEVEEKKIEEEVYGYNVLLTKFFHLTGSSRDRGKAMLVMARRPST